MRQTVLQHSAMRFISVVLLFAMIGACGETEVGPATGELGDEADAVEGPPVLVTVSNGRSVQVDEAEFTDSGVQPGPATSRVGNRARVRVGEPGKTMTMITMKAPGDSLTLIHVDASVPNDNTILVYGVYESEIGGMGQASSAPSEAALFSMASSEASKAGWECIWCRGGILACGVEPQCGR